MDDDRKVRRRGGGKQYVMSLVHAVRVKKENALTDTDILIAQLEILADQITHGKDILFGDEFDRPMEEIPPERLRYFTKSKAKWDGWLVEYELLLARLHKQNALPDAYRCQRCGLPVHTPWRSNETCEYCAGPNKEVFAQMVNNGNWIIINSKVLKESIVICRDSSIPITPEQRGLVRYLVSEVVLLEHAKEESLKQLHEIKKTIGGQIE